MEEPFCPSEVRQRLREALSSPGGVQFTQHALKRMEERDVVEIDVFNVLRGGAAEVRDYDSGHGCWVYRSWTSRFEIRYRFRGSSKTIVITVVRRN